MFANQNCNQPPKIMYNAYPPSPAPDFIPSHFEMCSDTIQGYLKQCLYLYVYVWAGEYGEFWMRPITYGANGSLWGYQWHQGDWRMIEIMPYEILSFY